MSSRTEYDEICVPLLGDPKNLVVNAVWAGADEQL
jgi:hypothetical protein